MNQFINVKALSGELKRTEIRRGMGYRLTNKEVILLREDISYHILLEDILGLISRDEEEANVLEQLLGDTRVSSQLNGVMTFKIVVHKMRVYNRSGVHERGASTVYANLSNGFSTQLVELLQAI
ncbi:hypothetical protein [Tumebacillus permanentifrigoris]|uniref:Uncharacterized protein n=1 Tax=Tumebacillus permanentifrigoris TaxID=378543 RepID=A0A316DG27_9BACL|nr:hypothetical protein [Tumebacillus permanentifrigoris]PWK15523.1 hypothetical protein C7459_10359 [Tumebacillus permanentifrigoris]